MGLGLGLVLGPVPRTQGPGLHSLLNIGPGGRASGPLSSQMNVFDSSSMPNLLSSTRITDVGKAISHSQGYFSILQGPQMDSREWTSVEYTRNERKAKNHESKVEKSIVLESKIKKIMVCTFQIFRKKYGFPLEVACRSTVGPFYPILIRLQLITAPPNLKTGGFARKGHFTMLSHVDELLSYLTPDLGKLSDNFLSQFTAHKAKMGRSNYSFKFSFAVSKGIMRGY